MAILDKIKETIEEERRISNEIQLNHHFNLALKEFNVETIKKAIESGFDIKNYEASYGPAISTILLSVADVILEYSKNFSSNYVDYYFYQIYEKELKDLSDDIKEFYESLQAKVKDVIMFLHSNGATINSCNVKVDRLFPLFQEKNETEVSRSVIDIACHTLKDLKCVDIINWITANPDFDNNFGDLVNDLVKIDTEDATLVLEHILSCGAKIINTRVDLGFNYNALMGCLTADLPNTKKDKMIILLKYAEPEVAETFREEFGTSLDAILNEVNEVNEVPKM